MTFRLTSLRHVGVPGLGTPNLLGLSLGGHIGPAVSALVDGQLSPEAEERAWRHVLGCPGCRRLVETEGWTKTRLATLATAPGTSAARETRTEAPAQAAPAGLLGALYDVGSWAEVDELERASRRRRAMVAVVGAGSIGAAVLGLVAVTTPPAGRGEVPGSPSPAMIRSDISGAAGSSAARAPRPGVTGLSGSGAGVVLGLRADAPTLPSAPVSSASPVSARGTDPQPVGGHASR